MKISELPHRDPAWAYIELNDGSLVAMPKEAIKELQEESKQIKADLEHARSYKHTIKMRNRNLQIENERLKSELQQRATNYNKIRCLALLLASEMYWFKSICNKYEGSDWWVKIKRQSVYYRKAYRKAKQELMEGK